MRQNELKRRWPGRLLHDDDDNDNHNDNSGGGSWCSGGNDSNVWCVWLVRECHVAGCSCGWCACLTGARCNACFSCILSNSNHWSRNSRHTNTESLSTQSQQILAIERFRPYMDETEKTIMPRGQWLKCNGTQGNTVPQPVIYGSMRSPTSDCYNAREKHNTIDWGPNPTVPFPTSKFTL